MCTVNISQYNFTESRETDLMSRGDTWKGENLLGCGNLQVPSRAGARPGISEGAGWAHTLNRAGRCSELSHTPSFYFSFCFACKEMPKSFYFLSSRANVDFFWKSVERIPKIRRSSKGEPRHPIFSKGFLWIVALCNTLSIYTYTSPAYLKI